MSARLILVGVRGFGAVHAQRIAGLRSAVELVATVDPVVAETEQSAHGAPLFASLEEALASHAPVDVVIVAAPLGDHFALAAAALRAGSDVYLEKPPVATLDDFNRLLELEAQTGRVVQVGFQSLGVSAAEAFASDAFDIGPVIEVGAVGAWSRAVSYWNRSEWAGRRWLDGRPVIDGVTTNPLAHAVSTALSVAAARSGQDICSVTTDLYRANAIEADDTSVVRIDTASGVTVTCALTLCAEEQQEPFVVVEAERGRARYFYTSDRVEVETYANGDGRTETLPRADLLENLLAHRLDGTPLLVPLTSTGAFMRVLDAVATAPEPTMIDSAFVRWEGAGDDARPVISEIQRWLSAAVDGGQTFAELGVPWALRRPDSAEIKSDQEVKRQRVLAILDDADADAVLLTSATALNWYLDGARTHVSLAADPVVAVRVSREGDEVLCTDNETARLVIEELPPGMTVWDRPWHVPLPQLNALPETALADQLRCARSPLLPGETDRFRRLGREAATILTDVAQMAAPDWTEHQLAGEVARRTVGAGMEPVVILVGGESRADIPHPLPTANLIGDRAMIVLCVRRHGLIVNLSRLVAFTSLRPAERSRMNRVLQVERAALDATTPGAPLASVLTAIADAYAVQGFGVDHWRGHHQGGVAGYAGRDPRAVPQSEDVITLGQAFAWNPWTSGAKVEDTLLLTDAGFEVLTADHRWPTQEVGGIARPVILER